ncbi:MAG: hypothetical protein RBS80_27695 [Thermoguttaceae bacterium]|nr:hypothetical protein [Thermoguttaceae bacterium]
MGLLFPIAAPAQERVGDVEFSAYPMPGLDSGSGFGVCHGYVEFRVRLKNLGKEDRVIHLSYPRTRGRQIDHGAVVTRTVRIAGAQEAVVSLYQPPVPVADERLDVRVEGVANSKEIRVASLHGYRSYSRSDSPQSAVLLSRSVPRDFPSTPQSEEDAETAEPFENAAAATTETQHSEVIAEWEVEFDSHLGVAPSEMDGTTPSPADRLALFRSELPVAQWSPNWLGYSCYDAIVCSEKEAVEMPPAVRLAVRRFVECGGMLLIHGRNVPAAFSEGGVPDGQGGCYVGMGHVLATLDGEKTDWNATYQKLLDTSIHVYCPEERPANLLDLLVAEATVPVRGLFLLVLVFGVVIGPANLWLLSRYRRRIWLWWNVPAISAVTCLLVFGYSLASDGVAARGKTATLTLLNQQCRRATTIGYVSYYSPLAPGGLRFSTDTDATLLETASSNWRHYRHWERPAGLCYLDWTHDQHLTSGWMKARVPAYFQVRKNADGRERLTVEPQPDGSMKVLNALGADVKRLYLADAAGRVFHGSDIPAGAERTLAAMAGATLAEDNPARMRAIFTNANWLGRFQEIEQSQDPAALLAPGCYIACLDRSPFVESPLAAAAPEHTVAIVYGIMKGQHDGR